MTMIAMKAVARVKEQRRRRVTARRGWRQRWQKRMQRRPATPLRRVAHHPSC